MIAAGATQRRRRGADDPKQRRRRRQRQRGVTADARSQFARPPRSSDQWRSALMKDAAPAEKNPICTRGMPADGRRLH